MFLLVIIAVAYGVGLAKIADYLESQDASSVDRLLTFAIAILGPYIALFYRQLDEMPVKKALLRLAVVYFCGLMYGGVFYVFLSMPSGGFSGDDYYHDYHCSIPRYC